MEYNAMHKPFCTLKAEFSVSEGQTNYWVYEFSEHKPKSEGSWKFFIL